MTDALDQAAELALRGLRETRSQLALKTAEHAALDVAYSTSLREIEFLTKQLERMTSERDHYQRYSHRVHTQLNEMGHQTIAIMRRFADIQTATPYLPHQQESTHPDTTTTVEVEEQRQIASSPPTPPPDDVPSFVKKGPRSSLETVGK